MRGQKVGYCFVVPFGILLCKSTTCFSSLSVVRVATAIDRYGIGHRAEVEGRKGSGY